MTFTPVTIQELDRLRQYYERCTYRLCEYSALVKLMWNEYLHPEYTEEAGCLIVRNRIDGKYSFDYPVPGPDGNEEAALSAIEAWCVDNETPLEIAVVPAAKAPLLLARYPLFRLKNLRSWRDYLYEAGHLRDFPGHAYSGQRNHVNKFHKLYPGAEYHLLGEEDREWIEQFWREYRKVFQKESEKAKRDLRLSEEMSKLVGRPCFRAGGMFLDGKLISFTMAERCGDTMYIHIEKALYGYEGVYPTSVQEFSRQVCAEEGLLYFNREDDADDRGLRTSKLQYHPTLMAEKYCFNVENELYELQKIPTLVTERLTLSELTDADRTPYNRLCLNDERNRWWGYDYRGDWKGEPLEDYFLGVAREDFAAHRAVNFAIRLGDRFIGEAILFRFDGRGSAELGCRIAPEYAGSGYGTEAFAAVAEWGLYKLHLSRVAAKCYKENAASMRMLSSCMRRSGEDDTFYYFTMEV